MKKFFTWIATCFGVGYLMPLGQGTVAALLGLFLVPEFLKIAPYRGLVMIACGIFLGVLSSFYAEQEFQNKDDHRIVIDEFASIFITFFGFASGISWYILFAGFFLNRLFDVWKPPPIFSLQKLSGGWGVMADDVAAGIYSNIVIRIFLYLFS